MGPWIKLINTLMKISKKNYYKTSRLEMYFNRNFLYSKETYFLSVFN